MVTPTVDAFNIIFKKIFLGRGIMFKIKRWFKDYYQLSKMGIVFFSLFVAWISYLLSLSDFYFFSLSDFLWFSLGFYLVCSGSFILNQAQEWRFDQKMRRTALRPIPQNKLSVYQGYVMALFFLIVGHFLLFLVQPITAGLTLLTVVLYNFFYTLWWKRQFKYGAVLGAVPGAMPVLIGYSLSDSHLLEPQCVYLFLLLFFWQMPHFWSLAIRYKEDYKTAGFPVLPVVAGSYQTLYQIGLYVLVYIGLALSSPLFLKTGLMYVFFLVPFTLMLFYQFYKYFYNPKNWLPFFLWINISLLVYFCVPILDRWIFQSVLRFQYAGF